MGANRNNVWPGGEGPAGAQLHDELYRQFSELEQIVQRIAKRLARESETLDDIADALSRLRTQMGGESGLAGCKDRKCDLPPLRLFDSPHEQPKAQKLQLDWHADGSASVRIDFGLWFKLPPALAELLNVLAEDSGESVDEIVAWKTEREIAARFTEQAKDRQPVSKRAVIQRIHRLRKLLVKQGIGDSLIQTNRRKGWRFALARNPAAKGTNRPPASVQPARL